MPRIRRMTGVRALALSTLLLAFAPGRAHATWSITAVDPRTREVGIAGASCTPDVIGIAGVVPGRGVIAAQALTNDAARRRGIEMLRGGASPMEIVRAVTDSVFDPGFGAQQYGVAALGHAPVAYTGAATEAWMGHALDADVSVQGNLLVGERVVGDAMAAYRVAASDTSESLADRLLLALEAGAAAGGDARCPGQTALSAFLIVAGPDDRRDAQHLRLYVNGQSYGGANPVALLRQRYDEWRRLIRGHTQAGIRVMEGNAWIAANAVAGWPALPWSQRPDCSPDGGGTGLVARTGRCL
ncbi:DUF1028 domain-containing protein [Longimicrobium sp.]|uniref:DUF1028 domain-containing protein n=1 Tax=Longimicrobium sp. TaxID=2029185 RepID=UPI002E2FD01A|nr:DUF1028 domain-containing protein [Longimicrobium sp.]HEX6042326.1 DUF1028 domain-containing protein [Longimicrobium sp.]